MVRRLRRDALVARLHFGICLAFNDASRLQDTPAVNIDDADAAESVGRGGFVIADDRYVDAGLLGRVKDGRAFWDADVVAVEFEIDRFICHGVCHSL